MKRQPRVSLSDRLGAVVLFAVLALGSLTPIAKHARAAHARLGATDTLTIGWPIETATLDPAANANNPDIWVMVNIYDQLLHVAPDGTTIVPDLATSWTISRGGTLYTFHLRPNVTFHNGMKLTSEDVKFCLLRAAQPSRAWSFLLTAIKSIATPDARTVEITLKHPWGPFLADMTLFSDGVYPEAYFKKVGASYLSSHPIGSGPYMLEEWRRGQFVRLKKNPKYWDAASYPMQHVEYDLLPDDNTKLLKLEGGELDVDYQVPYNQIAALRGNPAVQVQINPSTRTHYLMFQTQVKPFQDVNVRQAINHAIDRAVIIKAVTLGHATPANSFLPAGSLDYDPHLPVPTYNIALARRFLAASTVPHGFAMTMEIGSGDSVQRNIAVFVQQELARLGIRVTLKLVDQTTLFNDQNVGKYHFLKSSWTNDIPDPDELVSYSVDYQHGGSFSFYTYYNDPKMASLSRQAEQSNDLGTRKRLYYQIQEIFAQDVPFLYLYYAPYINAVSSRVHGFSENPLGYFNLRGVTKS